MTAPTIEQALPAAPVRVRPGRRTGRERAPQARPGRAVPAPSLRRSAVVAPHACRVEQPTVRTVRSSTWRLTERGVAVVLVTGAMILTAALVVVGLTALRVTGDSYGAVSSVSAGSR